MGSKEIVKSILRQGKGERMGTRGKGSKSQFDINTEHPGKKA